MTRTALRCCLAAALAGLLARPAMGADLVAEIDGLVRAHFYAPRRLDAVGWTGAVTQTRERIRHGGEPGTAINGLLALLGTSHTQYYAHDDPGYGPLAGIFERVLEHECPAEMRPALPVTEAEIGVFWKQLDGAWYVGGVYGGGPAAAAGLRLGDEVVSADGTAFAPVASFAGKADRTVALAIRREAGGPLRTVTLVPRLVRPAEALRAATAASWRVIERGGRRMAYLHVWTWTSPEIQQIVLHAATEANQEGVDGFILDLRDGWGGASPSYLTLFAQDVPVLKSIDRTGAVSTYDAQIRQPAALLVNGGTRSGKELIAYGAKKHHLATLVGERTEGAVVFGQPFCLSDGGLLLLAVADAEVDGERLEGTGVAPDIAVPFDLRHAAGADPQLDRAIELLGRAPTSARASGSR